MFCHVCAMYSRLYLHLMNYTCLYKPDGSSNVLICTIFSLASLLYYVIHYVVCVVHSTKGNSLTLQINPSQYPSNIRHFRKWTLSLRLSNKIYLRILHISIIASCCIDSTGSSSYICYSLKNYLECDTARNISVRNW
jgi:hypothetical protein